MDLYLGVFHSHGSTPVARCMVKKNMEDPSIKNFYKWLIGGTICTMKIDNPNHFIIPSWFKISWKIWGNPHGLGNLHFTHFLDHPLRLNVSRANRLSTPSSRIQMMPEPPEVRKLLKTVVSISENEWTKMPLVICYIANWKITISKFGKCTIFYGPFSIANC